MSDFDSSDEEVVVDETYEPLHIDFINLEADRHDDDESAKHDKVIGISSLPGAKFKETRRNLGKDLETIVSKGFTDIICLLPIKELKYFKTAKLLEECISNGLMTHHFPIEDGEVPEINTVHQIAKIILKASSQEGKKILLNCFCGYGRAGVVAASLILLFNPNISPDEAIAKVRESRGPRAIQSVKQYNFLQEFRTLPRSSLTDSEEEDISR